jgi:anti-anti-sigma regulatory factor
MEIIVYQTQGKVPVSILSIKGDLDGATYQDLIARAQEVYSGGARYILLDMANMPFMSSAGLVALHSIALILRGETPPNPEDGWGAFRQIDRDRDGGKQQHVKLLSPQPPVDRALEKTGLKQFFDIHTDRDAAIASFE